MYTHALIFNLDMIYNGIVEHQINELTITETLSETRSYYFGWRFLVDILSNSYFYFALVLKDELMIFRTIFLKLFTS